MKNSIKQILRIIMITLAIIFIVGGPIYGCYLTFYQMFYGGIVDMVTGATLIPPDAILIAKGAVKFVLCGVPGLIAAFVGVLLSSGFFAIWCMLDD